MTLDGVAMIMSCLMLIGGGGAWAAAPEPSADPSGSDAPVPSASASAAATGPNESVPPEDAIPDDLFTAPADPLTLDLSLAKKGGSKLIGPSGGTIKATGPDRTRYTLVIRKTRCR